MQVYLVNDHTLCNQSVFLVILISLDQLLILRKGVRYSAQETKPKACVKIGLAWLFAFLICGPAIIGWEYWVGYSSLDPDQCDVEFYKSEVYTFVEGVVEFVVPTVILAFVNAGVYSEIRKRNKVTTAAKRKEKTLGSLKFSEQFKAGIKGTKDGPLEAGVGAATVSGVKSVTTISTFESVCSAFPAANENISINNNEETLLQNRDERCHSKPLETNCAQPYLNSGNKTEFVTISDDDLQRKSFTLGIPLVPMKSDSTAGPPEMKRTSVPGCREETPNVGSVTRPETSDQTRLEIHRAKQAAIYPAPKEPRPTNGPSSCHIKNRQMITFDKKPQFTRARRKDLKAAKALFIFVFTFVVLWAPYSIATVAIAFCDDCVNKDLYEFFVWLLWFKSAVNPFVYAANSSRFKMNFVDILTRVFFCCRDTRAWKAWTSSGNT